MKWPGNILVSAHMSNSSETITSIRCGYCVKQTITHAAFTQACQEKKTVNIKSWPKLSIIFTMYTHMSWRLLGLSPLSLLLNEISCVS